MRDDLFILVHVLVGCIVFATLLSDEIILAWLSFDLEFIFARLNLNFVFARLLNFDLLFQTFLGLFGLRFLYSAIQLIGLNLYQINIWVKGVAVIFICKKLFKRVILLSIELIDSKSSWKSFLIIGGYQLVDDRFIFNTFLVKQFMVFVTVLFVVVPLEQTDKLMDLVDVVLHEFH